MLHRLIIVFLSMAVVLNSFCQSFDEKDFTSFTIKNGLVDNYITSIVQDELGYIWVGTDVGLCFYDGHSFSNYLPETANRQLLSQRISRLKKITPGHIGIVSRGGFQVLNTKDFTIQNFTIPDTTSFTTYLNYAWDAKFLANGSFAVTTTTGFYVFDKTGKLNFRFDAYKANDIGTKTVRYGDDIFSISDHEYLVYFETIKVAYYNSEKNFYRQIDSSETAWNFFYRPPTPLGNLWITKYQLSPHEFIFIKAGKDTIVYYDHTAKKTIASSLPFNSEQELTFESKITQLNDSVFVLNGGNQGFWLFTIDRKTGRITCDGKKYLAHVKVNCLFVDKDHRLWAGTPEGLLQQKLNKPFLDVYSFIPQSLNDSLTGSFACAFRYKDKLYAGRYSRYTGLVIFDTGTMKPIKLFNFYGPFSAWNEVRSIQMYHPDTLWIGTTAGFLWFDTKTDRYGKIADDKRIPDNSKFLRLNMSSATGKDGYAWFWRFLGEEVARYHPPTNTIRYFNSGSNPVAPVSRIKKIGMDAYGDVWLSGHSLARWNTRKEIFDTLMLSYGGSKKFNDNIRMLSADDKGSLWFHNDDNGLLQYIITEKKFVQYTVKDGLLSDNLEALSAVINNSLWIAYRAQLQHFNTHTKKMTTQGPWNSIQMHKPTGGYIYSDPASNLCYLFCKNEIIKFSFAPPATPPANNEILLQKMIINDSETLFAPGNDTRLKPGENSLAIYFTVINFESGADFKYAYTLNKAETWTQIGNQHYIALTGLPSGNYLLNLKATANSGQEIIKEFSFYIVPPFWKTAWFLSSSILVIAGILYYLHRRRIKNITQKANLDKLLAQTEMRALHSQMNPHFIFNCLNSIREMILNSENEQASLYLSKFARLIRITLNHSSETFVSLEDTIDYLRRYLEMEQIRKSNFSYTIDVDDDLQRNEIFLPPMLIQPFIENAIWHGAYPDKEMDLTIQFKREQHELICIVEDDGIGVEASLKNKEPNLTYQSIGIENIRQRIQVLNEKYNLQSTIDIKDKSGLYLNRDTGTIVTLHLPIKINESLL